MKLPGTWKLIIKVITYPILIYLKFCLYIIIIYFVVISFQAPEIFPNIWLWIKESVIAGKIL